MQQELRQEPDGPRNAVMQAVSLLAVSCVILSRSVRALAPVPLLTAESRHTAGRGQGGGIRAGGVHRLPGAGIGPVLAIGFVVLTARVSVCA